MKKITFIFALLCASVMGFAIDWSGVDWLANSNEKYKLLITPNFGDEFGGKRQEGTNLWIGFPSAAFGDMSIEQSGGAGAWKTFALSNFPNQENQFTVVCGGTTYTFDVYFVDGSTKSNPALTLNSTAETLDATAPAETFQIVPSQSGDGAVSYESSNPGIASVDNTGLVTAVGRGKATITVSTAETATYAAASKTLTVTVTGPINWDGIGWLSGSNDKYKLSISPEISDTYGGKHVQNGTDLWIGFPSAAFGDMSIEPSDGAGAWKTFALSNFPNQENQFTVVCDGKTYTFDVYFADGTGSGADPEPTEIYDVNFALQSEGGAASAKSGNDAGLANNGNTGDRWWSETAEMTDEQKNDQWWQVNLGQRRIFNTIQIVWEGAWGKSFDIQISDDGSAWTTVKEIRNQNLAGETFPYTQNIELDAKKTAQYVRFQGIERGTGYAYSFWEFRVLLPGVSTLTSIDLTSPATIAKVGGSGVALTATPKDQNGQAMEAEISYEITPDAAGHMSGNMFIPDQAVAASIRAYNGSVYSSAVQIIGVPSDNLAKSTNISTDNKIIAQSEFAPNGTDAFFAVDGNMGSTWQGSPTNGNVDDSREYDCWFVVDLGAYYNIAMVALHFEGACSELYHIDFSANNSDWNLGYNLVGTEGINARNDYWTELDNNTKVRYVRFWSSKSATGWGMKMYEFEVYGTTWESGDEEKPAMGTASLVSNTYDQAVIAVTATDNDEVARYHVVDASHGIDVNLTPAAGNITITGLTHATDYNFTITAKDASGNESDNSVVLPVAIPFNTEANLALNQPCEGGYYDNNPVESADKANDGNNGSAWVTYGAHAAELDWWVVDLGNIYNLTNITALWADDAYATAYMLQARVEAPTAADKADDAAWVTLATVSGVTAGEERSTNVSGVGRYVRFRATAFAGGFFRLRELRVFGSGVASVDTEAPAMESASLVSNTDSHALIAVAASDNQGIANYHVLDADNGFEGYFMAEAGQIDVSGLTGGTTYTLVITVIDFFGNESENSKSVEVTTTAHLTAPAAACPAPTWPAAQVKALYSPTYDADYTHQDWGGGTVATKDEFGRKYVTKPAPQGYFGADGFNLNCLLMEKLHYDIWIADDATIRIVPIWGGAEQGITVSLTGQQWNSIDIDLTEYTGVTNWGSITQMKIDNAFSLTFWIANAYFYREEPYVDDAAPYNAIASVTEESFYSVKIEAKAEDLSGAVNFKVMNGQEILATGAAATNVATTISVNNLASGTNYNFKVVAYDEAGNEAAPIQVAAATKFMPAPAPAPVFGNNIIVPVFTDAMEGAPATIHSGGWNENTIAQWIDIAPGDKVFYAQNFDYAGWHSWGDDIDATGMQFLHVDVYSLGMTSVSITPISHDPTHEGSAAIALTPNDWTSIDIALSAYEAANIEWNKIFQFKLMDPVGGTEFMIDNVYFWRYAAKTNVDGWSTYACAETVVVPDGITAYWAEYQKNGTEEILLLHELSDDGIIPAGAGVLLKSENASTTYGFTITAETPATDMSDNVLVGCADRTDISEVAETNDIFCLRRSELFEQTAFFLYSGQYVPAGKAYLPLPKDPSGPNPAQRRVRFVFSNEQVATGVGNVQNDAVQSTKELINGQLFIRRGDSVYTVQGVRVQ